MLARRPISPEFEAWNARWGAPNGRPTRRPTGIRGFAWKPDEFDERGMFGFQANNDTRAFEYPWAYFQGRISREMRVLEIGGGMSGFQFVLAKCGAHVVNVDPGMEDIGGLVSQAFFTRANAKYGTDVELVQTPIAEAPLVNSSFDLAYSISVIEHIPQEQLGASMRRVGDLLNPGGRLVMTVDLFLELSPFTKNLTNRWGSNASIRRLVEASRLELEFGERHELFGFPEFDAQAILERLPEFLIGGLHPTLVQCVVLRKSGFGH